MQDIVILWTAVLSVLEAGPVARDRIRELCALMGEEEAVLGQVSLSSVLSERGIPLPSQFKAAGVTAAQDGYVRQCCRSQIMFLRC